MPYVTPLIFTSISQFHSSILRRSSATAASARRCVDHDVDTPVRPHDCLDQSLHPVTVGDVCSYGECLAAAACQLICLLMTGGIDAPCTQHNACALRGEKPGGCLTQPAAGARDDDDFSFDVIVQF